MMRVSVSHEKDPSSRLALNYGIVDSLSAYFGRPDQRRMLNIDHLSDSDVRILI